MPCSGFLLSLQAKFIAVNLRTYYVNQLRTVSNSVSNLNSDKYLIAQTFIYFTRCRFRPEEYTQTNFFLLLYLANDMEEDLDFKVTLKINENEIFLHKNF